MVRIPWADWRRMMGRMRNIRLYGPITHILLLLLCASIDWGCVCVCACIKYNWIFWCVYAIKRPPEKRFYVYSYLPCHAMPPRKRFSPGFLLFPPSLFLPFLCSVYYPFPLAKWLPFCFLFAYSLSEPLVFFTYIFFVLIQHFFSEGKGLWKGFVSSMLLINIRYTLENRVGE